MAARIVDVLEVVAVDIEDRQRIAAACRLVDEAWQFLVEEGAVRKAGERVVRGEVLQRELVFLRAAFGFAPVRDVLQQHGVNPAGARIEVGDRELHVAPFVIAADDLRRAALGRFVALAGGASDTGVSKIVATSRRRNSSSDAPIRRCACGLASSTRREVGSNSTMPEAARSKMAR